MVIFMNNYTPSQVVNPFLKSLILFFILLTTFLFLQAFLRKGILEAGFILLILILGNFFKFLK